MTVNISNFSEPVAVNRLRSTRRDFAQHFIFGEMLIFSTIYLSNRLTSLGGLNFFNWVIIVATILTTFGRPIILKLCTEIHSRLRYRPIELIWHGRIL